MINFTIIFADDFFALYCMMNKKVVAIINLLREIF